jgi:mycothiol synthase
MNVRPLRESDLEDVLALLAQDEEHFMGHPSRIGLADLRQWLAGVDFERHAWLFDDGGELAAFGWCNDLTGEVAFAVGVVAVPYKGQGLGARLVDRAEAVARAAGPPRRLHQVAFAADEAATALLESRGYVEVRRFYEMAVELRARPDAPQLPDGLAIEQLDVEDARSFHAALDEAFQDHWEHRSRPFEEWWQRRAGGDGFDPSLWFLIRDGDEIAATLASENNRNGGGYIAAIGVRRPWRGRGLARALLLHAFREFHARGTTRITLGVDAENPTGAIRLYESIGMAPEQEQTVFEKALT